MDTYTWGGSLPLSILDDRPHRYTTSQPFTYRDTLTTLREIEELKCNLNKLVDYLNDMSKDLDDFEKIVKKALEDILIEFQQKLDALESRLIETIKEANAHGVAESPVRGRTQALDFVLGDMYDNLRYYGLFAKDYDDMGLTAKEYDDMQTGARRYDLQASRRLNPMLGDYKGRDDFWARLPQPPAEKPQETFLTKEEARKQYMTRHPDSNQFEEKSIQ